MLLPPNRHNSILIFHKVLVLLLISVIGTLGQPAEQQYISKKFTTENGLCHDYIQWITQDKTGFLWMATWDGVSRFDGYEFKNYYHQPEEKNTLPFFAVNKILTDSMNNVWAVSFRRPLVRYDRARDCFVREDIFQTRDSVIWDLDFGTGHTLSVLTPDGIFMYDPKTGTKSKRLFHFLSQEEKQFFYQTYYQLSRDNKGEFWLTGLSSSNEVFFIYKVVPAEDLNLYLTFCGSISTSSFLSLRSGNEMLNSSFYVSPSGKTWLFTKYGLHLLEPFQREFKPFTGVLDPSEYACGSFYYWTDDSTGLHGVDVANKKYIHIPANPGYFMTVAFLDRSQTIWSGDLNPFRENMGLNRYTPVPGYFRHFLTEKGESGNNRLIFPICQGPDGEIWAGTRHADDLFRILKDGRVIRQSFYDRNIGSSHPRIRSMVRDSDGIWLGCTENFLVRYDFTHRSFKSLKINLMGAKCTDPNLALHNILAIEGGVLINGNEGIYRYQAISEKIELGYRHREKASAFSFVRDNRDGFWVGYKANTIVHLDKNLHETGRYMLGEEVNNVEHILPGDSTDVWVALMGGGLAHFFPETGEVKFYTSSQGLINNTVYSMLKDQSNHIWISTNAGISELNPLTGLFRNFGKKEGLMVREFNSDSWYQSSDGTMYFGGVGGLVAFHPDSIHAARETAPEAPLLITDFFVSGLPRYFEKAVYEMDMVKLQKGDNNCQIRFASLDFRNPERVVYRYRLLPENERWTTTDFRNRTVSFTNLIPGEYRLEIQSTGISGDWTSQTTLMFIIPPWFYETLWFRVFIGLLLLALIVSIFALYLHQIRLKEKQLHGQLVLESLRGQMNPHFIFNSLNSINYFISRNDKFSANHYISDFSRLIRSILNNLSKEYIPFEKEVESLHDYLKLEHLRFSDKFNYTVKYDALGDLPDILVFPGMVQPFVENAIWHGVRGLEERIGFIRIEFLPHDEHSVQCIVEDDGVGRKLAGIFNNNVTGKKSRGIGIVLERLRIVNEMGKNNFKITIEDIYPEKEETGTRVIIDIPMKINV